MQPGHESGRRGLAVMAAVVILLLIAPAMTRAGMPQPALTEVGRFRHEVLSFFVVLFLVLSLGFQLLWNLLRRDFPALPRLSYPRALACMLVLGLAFNLILVMISGARELMTPGAWERHGAVNRLRDAAGGAASPTRGRTATQETIERLEANNRP